MIHNNVNATATSRREIPAQNKTGALSRCDILPDIRFLRGFMCNPQISVLGNDSYYPDRMKATHELIRKTADMIKAVPKSREQEGLGDKAICHLHYFSGSMDFYIVEITTEEDDVTQQAYGLSVIDYAEQGYISIGDLIEHDIELDLYWTPITMGEAIAKHKS